MVAVTSGLEVRVVELEQVVGEVPKVHGHAWHHSAAVRAQQRTVVAGFDLSQVLDPFLDEIRNPVEDRRPFDR